MKKLKSTLPNMIISLTCVTMLAGALLGGVYAITAGPIAETAAAQQKAAIAMVAPPFDNDPEQEAVNVKTSGGDATVYPARMGNKLVGGAVKASSMEGFGGQITVICGFDADGSVRNYEVLSQAETPGLGTKMQDWFRSPQGNRSIIGKNPDKVKFYVSKDDGEIDAITAATISSRAFLSIVREAHAAYMDYAKEQKQ